MHRTKQKCKTNRSQPGSILLFIIFCTLFIGNSFGQAITWQKVLDNTYGWINKVQQTSDGGYIAVGTDRINNQAKIYLVKLDFLGNVLWTKIFGSGENQGNWVEETYDKGFIIGGSTTGFEERAYVIKTDSLGNIQWERTYAASDMDACYCVKQTSDNGFILCCITFPYNIGAFYIKTDALGTELWRKIYYNNSFSIATTEIEIINNGYISVGAVYVNARDVYVMKLNLQGDTLWTRRFGGTDADGGSSIDKISNDGFIVGGFSKSFNLDNKEEAYVCRLDTSGNLIWQRTYSNLGEDNAHSIRFKPGTGFIMAGISDSLNDLTYKAKLRLIDLNGNILFGNSFLPSNGYANFDSVELTDDNGFVSAGSVAYQSNLIRYYIVKSDSLLRTNPIGINILSSNVPNRFVLYQNYPNPFNPATNIKFDVPQQSFVKLSIFDILGKEVEVLVNNELFPGVYNADWNASSFASGVYFFRMAAGEFTDVKKMVLVK